MIIAGVDEAGRGPLAGPVVAAAVILCDGGIAGLDDSKKLSPKKRGLLEAQIMASCIVGIGMASVAEIDAINIPPSMSLLMATACRNGSIQRKPSSVAMPSTRVSLPPASSPRNIGTGSWSRRTLIIPAMVGRETRAMARRFTWLHSKNWVQPLFTGAHLPLLRNFFRFESKKSHHHPLSPSGIPDPHMSWGTRFVPFCVKHFVNHLR
jgi:hypothetical protein